MGLETAVEETKQKTERGRKEGSDATQTIDAGEFSLPPKELMEKALNLWSEVGLPEFEVPRRAASRVARS